MTVVTQIVSGKVDNNGIDDRSIPDYAVSQPSSPKHVPVVHVITPIGKLASQYGTQWINIADFAAYFGDISDDKTPFYNPISRQLAAMVAGGQSTIGVRRLAANNEMARVSLSAFVQKVTQQDYERDLAGNFKRDAQGNKIPTGSSYEGLDITIKPDPTAATLAVGGLKRRTIAGTPANGGTPAVPDTEVFPICEGLCGVGDDYNRNGLRMGVVNDTLTYRSITDFVKATGVFPFSLQMFTDAPDGTRTFAKVPTDRRQTVPFTLFDTVNNKVRYGLKNAFSLFTGMNANRKVNPTPAPFNDLVVYEDNIATLCQAMYAFEKPVNTSLVEVSSLAYQQMNPFTCTNHTGAPYYAITCSSTVVWDLTGAVKATGGVAAYLDKDGKVPAAATPYIPDDPFGILTDVVFPITKSQAWEVTNALIASDLTEYLASLETKNYTRNRQSSFYDVGFTQKVKDLAAQLLASRRDIQVFLDATVWNQGKPNDLTELYSRASQLSTTLQLYPESTKWGTPSCRGSVNLIEAKITGEATGGYFSMNIEHAYLYAKFGGNAAGTLSAANMPSKGDNRILTLMHSPNIEFEEDYVNADNLTAGCISLRPYDSDRLFRAAMPTVYPNIDSVLKDADNVFEAICIEKILQDVWNTVCGDNSMSASDYVAAVKDRGERRIRDEMGGIVKGVVVSPTYNETVQGGRAVMNTTVSAYFNKAKYMMTLDLLAYNEEDLTTSS